jgi:hypothetical protein
VFGAPRRIICDKGKAFDNHVFKTFCQEHKQACQSKLKQRSLKDMMFTGLDTQTKNAELKLVAFVVEHNLPMVIMDHVLDLLREVCPDSIIAKCIKSARAKTTIIFKNVLGAYSS